MAKSTTKRHPASPGTYFHPGERVKIYQKPLTQEDFEDEAILYECIRPYTEFNWPGLTVEEWRVSFLGEPDSWVRVIAVPTIPVM